MNELVRHLCIVMERRSLVNRWIDHQWEAIAVLPASAHHFESAEAHCLLCDEQSEQWLHPALPLSLHADEVDNYLLNLSAPEPRLFVITREQDGRSVPFMLSVSYGEAARMLDAGETVDSVALTEEMWEWVMAFSRDNFRPPEPKKEKRYARAPQFQGARS